MSRLILASELFASHVFLGARELHQGGLGLLFVEQKSSLPRTFSGLFLPSVPCACAAHQLASSSTSFGRGRWSKCQYNRQLKMKRIKLNFRQKLGHNFNYYFSIYPNIMCLVDRYLRGIEIEARNLEYGQKRNLEWHCTRLWGAWKTCSSCSYLVFSLVLLNFREASKAVNNLVLVIITGSQNNNGE